MKRPSIPYLSMAVFVLLLAVAGPAHALNQIKWHSYEEGLNMALSENKKIFINFHADWCKFCHTMDRQTFKDPDVIAFLNSNFIAIKVDADHEKSVARKYNINPLPDSWFLSEKGEVIGNKPGYLPAKEMMLILQFVHTESYLKMSYGEFRKSYKP